MAKRLADTEKYKKKFIRGLSAPYKLLWDYICLDCNHAGIWEVDFEVAQLRLGKDVLLDETEALRLFNADEKKIEVLNNGSKWFIRPFIDFQYGKLDPNNRVHFSVLTILKKEGIKGLARPLQDPKNKDKAKDKDKDKDKDRHLDFVLLTKQEHQKLLDRWGQTKLDSLIELLNNGIGAKGYKYKSHYHALLNWEKRELTISKPEKTINNREEDILLKQAKEELGRMAKLEDIVKWLNKLPKHLHGKLRVFLITRYPKDGDQAYGNAEVLYTRGAA